MGISDIVDKLIRGAGAVPPVDRSKRTLVDGSPVTPDHLELKENGQQKSYVVLSEEERKRGFVRPVRRSYVHVGIPGPKAPFIDLTDEERKRWNVDGDGEDAFAKFEPYPEGSPSDGRYWTQAEVDKIDKGCGVTTTMSQALAETYARDPHFYSGTFCCGCGKHFPVGARGEFVWLGDSDQRVGT